MMLPSAKWKSIYTKVLLPLKRAPRAPDPGGESLCVCDSERLLLVMTDARARALAAAEVRKPYHVWYSHTF
jgi:hypothetical protein